MAWAWTRLFGFPWDPRLWAAFFVHDLGYWGCPNMDGPAGERHPEWAAKLMTRLFDGHPTMRKKSVAGERARRWECFFRDWDCKEDFLLGPWGQLVLLHSRFYAKANRRNPSRLCIADKLAICLTPAWIYLPTARASGEIHEYMADAHHEGDGRYASMGIDTRSGQREWYDSMRAYLRRWVEEHRDGREDTWTPDTREARDETGVWR